MRPAKENVFKDNFGYNCECKHEICYMENPIGSCDLKNTCRQGEQLNRTGSKLIESVSDIVNFLFLFQRLCGHIGRN